MSKNLIVHGHGHVVPRLDGFVARCGGPALCDVCAQEKKEWEAEKKQFAEEVFRSDRLEFKALDFSRAEMQRAFGDNADWFYQRIAEIANAVLAERLEKASRQKVYSSIGIDTFDPSWSPTRHNLHTHEGFVVDIKVLKRD